MFAIPPGTPYEDESLWDEAIEETKQRGLWREAVRRRDPQLAAMYTDRRARLRRRVQHLVTEGYLIWMSYEKWLMSESLAEARAVAEGVEVPS